MKWFFFFFLILSSLHRGNAQDNQNHPQIENLTTFFEKCHDFFATHVVENRVRYAAIQTKPQALNQLLAFIASAEVDTYNEAQHKAFFINSYNLLVIKNVIDHYPLVHPTDISGFFDAIKFKVAGKKTTLNNLEQKELLLKYKDGRLHFVLVCAAISCPPIANFAYIPEKLEHQLDAQTKLAMDNEMIVKVDDFVGKTQISKLFEWYASDFKPNVKAFINTYKTEALPSDTKLIYFNYNWTLNDVRSNSQLPSQAIRKTSTDFEPIIVAATMPKNTFELNTFHSLYTSNYGDKEYGSRGSYWSSLFLFSYGLTGRFDIGIDFILKSYRSNDLFNSSPFRALEFNESPDSVYTPDGASRQISRGFALSHVGPRVRFAPFKKISLSFEQAFYFPITGIPANNTVDPAIYWVSQIYYDHQFNSKLGLFFALTFWQPILPGQTFEFQVPYLKIFFSWYASKRFTLYATTTTFTEWGAGAKLLITPQFEIQALYTYYVPIPGLAEIYTGIGAKNVMTFNLGIRYRATIRTKQTAVSLE